MESGAGGAKIITMTSDKLPKAIGPFSAGKMIRYADGSVQAWSSGQLGFDPATGNLVSDDVVEQATQVLTNLKNLAADNGFDLEQHCIKNIVYLVSMDDFLKVNEVYKQFFTADYPARTCIAVSALPKGGKVEIESIFFKPAAAAAQ